MISSENVILFRHVLYLHVNEGVRSKMAFFVFRPSSQDQKGLSDTKTFLTPLACEILFNQF